MVQIDIPAAFIASQFFLDIGRKAIKREVEKSTDKYPSIYYRFLFRAVFFASFVIAPAGIYLLVGWPGWEQMYWTERVEKPIFHLWNAMIYPLFIMAIVLGAYIGHIVGYRWLVAGKEKYLRATYISLLILVFLIVILNYPAFTLVGTYQQYHFNRESMEAAWNNPHDFGVGWLIIMVYFAVSFLYLFITIRKENTKGVN
jgi:MFS family permease